MCLISSPFLKSQMSKRWLSRKSLEWCGCNLMLKCLSTQHLFPYSLSWRVDFQGKKNECLMAIWGTLCEYYRPHPTIIFEKLKYDKLRWNKNILSFEIQILNKISPSGIKIYYFNISFWNYCIAMPGDSEKGINDCTKERTLLKDWYKYFFMFCWPCISI